ncbi:MAG: cellulase family glycosylhydrolase, partial [Bacteroidales bacterium]|nr:cellulase family glycosylhydrolase [Bacteroidales bacterium]
MKSSCLVLVFLVQLFTFWGCAETHNMGNAPNVEFKSSVPENNASNVSLTSKIEVVFDQVISLTSAHGITINDAPADVKTTLTRLIITAELESQSHYTIVIPKAAVVNNSNRALEDDVELTFATEKAIEPNSSAMAFVANMGVGWNLGNTLDTKSADETAWGNPLATKALIDAVRAKGFKTLRVPVTWQYHMGNAPDYTIEKEWLDRVEEVVNYGLDNGMTVILNIHHDEEWLMPTYAQVESSKGQLEKVWTQIAERFKSYSQDLIFESLNEPRLTGSAEEWSGGTAEGRDCVNQYHQVAVDAIRAAGGNNGQRYIMISSYAASATDVAKGNLIFPSSSHLIASIHHYYPYELCLGDNGSDWGTDADKQALDNEFDKIEQTFIAKGIPVIMGEWGNLNHDNEEDRVRHADYYAQGCLQRGICPIWWDNGSPDNFALIDRHTYEWLQPEIVNALVNNVSTTQNPNFHIYLCFGQSNMEGQGAIEAQDRIVDSRFLVMQSLSCEDVNAEKGEWRVAVPPLCQCGSGLSPADGFGRTMVENTPENITIGVINVAIGGCDIRLFDKNSYQDYDSTYIEEWFQKKISDYGGNPYQHLINLARLGQKEGVIKGILLHQGETNTG